MTKVEQVAEQLDQLTLLEAAQLSKLLQDKWGVSAAAPMAVASMPGMAGMPIPGIAATAMGAAADTPHFSWRSFDSWAASRSVNWSSCSAT